MERSAHFICGCKITIWTGGFFVGDADVTVNHAVSLPINISIQNLITDFYHSQGFFQPSLGQTQQVSASFTANCDWTLQIFDPSSNAVRDRYGQWQRNEFSNGMERMTEGQTIPLPFTLTFYPQKPMRPPA
ncbi:MAG: hypothetical protein WDN00_10130 [Limisphaerales bacterium]